MSTQPHRLPAGGRIDRSRPLNYSFNGRAMQGYAGDTLASALLAAGVSTVARSFKYGRPRGIVGHGAEEPNAIVHLGSGGGAIPNLRATEVELYEGLEARSTRSGPQRLTGAFGGLFPAGFYYKIFMQPPGLWLTWERLLRRAAGLGEAPDGANPNIYDQFNGHCDVLVIGAGPAGLAAALEAARAGARTLIADEQREFGGSLLASVGDGAEEWMEDAIAELKSRPNVTLLPRATVVGCYDHNFFTILERRTDHLPPGGGGGQDALPPKRGDGLPSRRSDSLPPRGSDGLAPGRGDGLPLAGGALSRQHRERGHPVLRGQDALAPSRQRLHRVRAGQAVLASGAIERPVVFANNDRPGVMLASSVATYLNRYAVAPGNRLVLFTTNDNAYATALAWQSAGREVAAIVDARSDPGGAQVKAAIDAGMEVIGGHAIIEALGRSRARGAVIAPLESGGDALAGPSRRLDCDLIACSGGWSPALHLSSQTGARPRWSEKAAAFLPGDSGKRLRCAGAVTGARSLRECLESGAMTGALAASRAGFGDGGATLAIPDTGEPPEDSPQALYRVPHRKPVPKAPKQFVDMQMDVTVADIRLAAREGYTSVEHVKRYTALGFGTDQGKLGNVNGVAILAQALGQDIAATGTTMFRPAYTPMTFGAAAGRNAGDMFDPERHTPMHGWHEEHGAVWEDVGRWKRPHYYPQPGETMREAVNRECRAARSGVAILDASTLGKIDIQGTDAAEFLDRIYSNGFRKLAVGKCRYGLMLREDGMIFDDGVTARIAEHRYLMHTTTGNAEAVFAWLELWKQTEWPELDVHFTSVTDHWATAAVVGPRSRTLLQSVGTDIDLSAEAFRFMDVREGHVADIPARVLRISFSGELSFEVNVPADRGREVWDALMDAGEEFGITPYGTETMHVLRAEKGFIIVGQDTDGSMTPADMGMSWAVRHGKPFGFIGDRSLALADLKREDRLQLVGLATANPETVLPEGAQLLDEPQREVPAPMQGYVTSSYYSACLSRSIALAMVKKGSERAGQTLHAALADGRFVPAEIVSPVFYDAEGARRSG